MKRCEVALPILIAAIAVFSLVGGGSIASAQMHGEPKAVSKTTEPDQSKIERALSAAPPDIAKNATVVDKDSQGKTRILRAGTNEFTCMPGDPGGVGMPAMCEDKASMQWDDDFRSVYFLLCGCCSIDRNATVMLAPKGNDFK